MASVKQQAFKKKEITPKSQNFSAWYNDVVLKAELADYSPVKGCMVIRPYGYEIWENVQKAFNQMIKKAGVKNAYFPLFIPESLLRKEKEHIEGFSPELAVVTIGGGQPLTEKLVVRPTSETIMYKMYAKWIQSHRDLPLLINQWNNIVRWEKRTYLFLRTTEFLWQEGHTAHQSEKEAVDFQRRALHWYQQLYENYYAMAGIVGVKSRLETFAGAKSTWTIEFLMPNGKALQGCTSHNLGQNFSKAFNITFQDEKGRSRFVWQTSWGLSTRSIGGLIMTHGDDQGLVLPPKLAPIQVVIIPIPAKNQRLKPKIQKYIDQIAQKLQQENISMEIDDREEYSVGWKYNYWELKGVPLRLEIGEAEVKQQMITVVRRDKNLKFKVEYSKLKIKELLAEVQKSLLEKAKKFLKQHTFEVETYQEFKKIMKERRGFLKAFWCQDSRCEVKIKEETKATIRALPLTAKKEKGKCIYCGRQADYRWYFAQAY